MLESEETKKKNIAYHENDIYRILTPSEYDALRGVIPKPRLQAVMDCLMFTGMRYSELRAFAGNPQWFDYRNRAISLPGRATKTGKTRVVHLTPEYSRILRKNIRDGLLIVPTLRSMEENLDRWANDVYMSTGMFPAGTSPTPKTFRKSWESWLLFAGYDSLKVALSQGHTQTIQLNHYANMSARLKSEADAVKEYTRGWMT